MDAKPGHFYMDLEFDFLFQYSTAPNPTTIHEIQKLYITVVGAGVVFSYCPRSYL
jgi:ribosome biogenesis protein Tsr3